jgi:hypothetical protein
MNRCGNDYGTIDRQAYSCLHYQAVFLLEEHILVFVFGPKICSCRTLSALSVLRSEHTVPTKLTHYKPCTLQDMEGWKHSFTYF